MADHPSPPHRLDHGHKLGRRRRAPALSLLRAARKVPRGHSPFLEDLTNAFPAETGGNRGVLQPRAIVHERDQVLGAGSIGREPSAAAASALARPAGAQQGSELASSDRTERRVVLSGLSQEGLGVALAARLSGERHPEVAPRLVDDIGMPRIDRAAHRELGGTRIADEDQE